MSRFGGEVRFGLTGEDDALLDAVGKATGQSRAVIAREALRVWLVRYFAERVQLASDREVIAAREAGAGPVQNVLADC
jgi:predicted transcriptional regulator